MDNLSGETLFLSIVYSAFVLQLVLNLLFGCYFCAVGCVAKLPEKITLGLASRDIVVVGTKKTKRNRWRERKEIFTGICITITVTKHMSIPPS